MLFTGRVAIILYYYSNVFVMSSPVDDGSVDVICRSDGHHIAILQTQSRKPYVPWVRCMVPGKIGLRFIYYTDLFSKHCALLVQNKSLI